MQSNIVLVVCYIYYIISFSSTRSFSFFSLFAMFLSFQKMKLFKVKGKGNSLNNRSRGCEGARMVYLNMLSSNWLFILVKRVCSFDFYHKIGGKPMCKWCMSSKTKLMNVRGVVWWFFPGFDKRYCVLSSYGRDI